MSQHSRVPFVALFALHLVAQAQVVDKTPVKAFERLHGQMLAACG